jgi:hypothetical protein
MAPAAVIDCPRGVAPERMPKADATGLAPKKSADRTLPHTIRRCGRVWLPPCPPALILQARPNPRCRAENKPYFFGGALSGGLGLKTRRPPGRFCRALRIRFLLFCHRDTGHAYTGKYPIPPARHSAAPSTGQTGKESEKLDGKYSGRFGGKDRDPLHNSLVLVVRTPFLFREGIVVITRNLQYCETYRRQGHT